MEFPPLIVAVGFLVGMLIGLTGMGGGAIMTPFLILVLKIEPLVAIGTDLVFAALTKWVSGFQHRRQDNVGLRMVFWMSLGSLPAAYLVSSYVLAHVGENLFLSQALPRLLGGVLLLVSLYTLARTFDWIRIDENVRWPPAWALTVIGGAGGALVGLTSVGSGTVIMASLLIFFALPPSKLVGLDVMHGALLTSVPAGVYTFSGRVEWSLVLWLLLGSIPGALLGTRLIDTIPQRLVRTLLALLLLLAALKLLLAPE